jgi:hypothetical protein
VHRWAGVALCLLTSLALPAAEPTLDSEFKGTGICRFALHGFELGPQSEASINQAVQKLLERHQATFEFTPRPDFHVRMRVYARFEDFTNVPAMRHRSRLAGLYVEATREIVTWRQAVPAFLGPTLLHEASHAIMHAHFRRLPVWFSEGVADYFAYAAAGRNELNDRALRRRWALLNLWAREDRLPALPALLNANDAQWGRIEIEQAYTVSWSLVQFLMGTETNRQMMKQMLAEWQERGARRVPSTEQLERLYPGGLEAFLAAWQQWIDRTGANQRYKVPWQGSGLCRFALHGCVLPPAVEATVNRQVQALLDRHRAVLGTERAPDQPLRFRLFGEFQDYVRFTTNWMVSGWEVSPTRLAGTDGYANPLSEEIVTWNPKSPDELTRQLLRLAHDARLQEAFPTAPRWARIGSLHALALSQDVARNGQLSLAAAWQQARMAPATLPSWRALLNDTAPRPAHGLIGGLTPSEIGCWAVFEFLASSEANRQILQALLKPSASLANARPADAARLERLYPGGAARFEADFKQWLGRQGVAGF